MFLRAELFSRCKKNLFSLNLIGAAFAAGIADQALRKNLTEPFGCADIAPGKRLYKGKLSSRRVLF
jgi:hypothetical protein